ncbi:MAG: Gfo/Idh/MocA family oxidoreductase [Abditibacteriota bacterium]|nr:Gfo/Idh/MocA family oxidoreductase [Abditibacteriota bacterium]
MTDGKLKIALAGLGFGGAFAEIYKCHPLVGEIRVFDPDRAKEQWFRDNLGIEAGYGSFEDILADDTVDAVHLVTPIPLHGRQSVAVLDSGKHCACTVPMGVTLEELRLITEARRKSGKNYMMMETTLYTYQFMYVQKMLSSGELGRIQFMKGTHYQDMENWPPYWDGLPPMHYGTHAIAPMVALSGSRIARVHAFGSGTMREELVKNYGNPFPVETAIFAFENGLKGEATRSLFETARMYQEGMFVFGSKKSFEWGFTDNSDPIITTLQPRTDNRGCDTVMETVKMPNDYSDLPEELWRFTVGANYDPLRPQESLKEGAGAGHHGSHSHLVNEFVMSIVEGRKPWIDEVLGANITAAGICAHLSALRDGAEVTVPVF